MSNPSDFMHLLKQIFSKPFKLLFYASPFWQMLSRTISSQPCMTWHKSWSLLPCKRDEHANPRGSYIKLKTESMPRLKSILNFITSFSVSSKIRNALSSRTLPVKSFSLAPTLLNASGIWNNKPFLLLMNFVSLNPPLLHRSVTFWISVRASLTDGTDSHKNHPHKNFSEGY